ncbi:alanine--tRNA ligase [Candidatus Liberibacter americanus]|uniref:Alanine--tRNA ligase n=1 Tax=Candidatus Liberibacter americanus str. Sao Paulo TaxID=1261131 RepID=U6B5E6_9HYPH|nr:alanine--tRNA ligase [Candidatus Liberibacter americanus]AHA27898.1 Alanyl-tRNA synthetase [Candidatus Liberibacter americanus str. Sao Paulo]EMS36103.1 alanyl-tRNA synthetase [Candidatus Liberibacter americanus PW_SP]
MSNLNSIRSTFIEFFKKNGHQFIDSSPLVPKNDPTLMFTNAGMVQFKNIFTGQEFSKYKKVTTVQKCVRAGGKHNDLDNVGRTTRHHTFFEMLGNFSFGDYFKEMAIKLAWDLLTKEFDIDHNRILITVYESDHDSFNLWKIISGLSSDKIIRISGSDNFWSMADIGPCGPCSEIFFDRGDKISGGLPGSGLDGDRYIEMWNLVFMQFDQKSKDERIVLPNPSIDTGMGLERMAAVLQGKVDNYDIDIFKALISASEQITGKKYCGDNIINHRVIVDHLRSSAFLIAEGVLPTNEGRGYVLRRIIRRAMCYARLMGFMDPVMNHLLPTLYSEMGDVYPELIQAQALISSTLEFEYVRFNKTLDRGIALLDEVSSNLEKNAVLAGDIAFKLYDTHGLPLDIMQDILWSRGCNGVDILSFNKALEAQRIKARGHSLGLKGERVESIWLSLNEKYGATQFLGYDINSNPRVNIDDKKRSVNTYHDNYLRNNLDDHGIKSIVLAIVHENKIIDKAESGQTIEIVFNRTPFYAESGGQIGDIGLAIAEDVHIEIIDVQKQKGGILIHHAIVKKGVLRTSMPVLLIINVRNRYHLSLNHSATHLLNWALRTVIGPHVAQKGSLITPDRLRFDITHPQPITNAEIKSIENKVNCVIAQNLSIVTRVMDINDAIASGASTLFGKTYGDKVRVVSIEDNEGNIHSSELCGGTHVYSTGEIMLMHIISESSSSSGIRRIEAITEQKAREYLVEQDDRLKSVANFLKVQPSNVLRRVEEIWEDRRQLQLMDSKRKLTLNIDNLSLHKIADINFMSHVIPDVSSKELRGLIDIVQKKIKSGIVMLIGIDKAKKASVVISVSSDLINRFNAVDLVCLPSKILGGKKGGGRPNIAQSGGPDGKNAGKAIESVISFLKSKTNI